MSGDKQTIIDLETRFWQSMVDKDAKLAKSMIAQECLLTGPMGATKIDPDRYESLTEEGQWTLRSFRLSDVDVIMPSDEVAVIAYKVHQKGEMKGKPMDMKCADSSTWVRAGKSWKCALHTETMLQNA